MFTTVVEIHRSRTAEIQELPKWALFSSSHASVALCGILQKTIDEASKMNNFQKKVYQKRFTCRGDM